MFSSIVYSKNDFFLKIWCKSFISNIGGACLCEGIMRSSSFFIQIILDRQSETSVISFRSGRSQVWSSASTIEHPHGQSKPVLWLYILLKPKAYSQPFLASCQTEFLVFLQRVEDRLSRTLTTAEIVKVINGALGKGQAYMRTCCLGWWG